jgi:hypothetical protein
LLAETLISASAPQTSECHQKRYGWARLSRLTRGATGKCEAELWCFTGSSRTIYADEAARLNWVAAESLDAALLYVRQRYDDFMITEASFVGMISLLSGAPLD